MYVHVLVSTLDPELQDEILTVLRRVDENWAEGMLGDKVGIFPLLYVEVRLCHPSPPVFGSFLPTLVSLQWGHLTLKPVF